MNKKLFNIGIGVYAILVALSVVFFKERTIFLDNSFFLFDILRNDSFCVQRYRYIAAIPQILPLLAAKLSLSLKWVMIGFSASFILYQAVCYAFCGLVLKNYKIALVLLFTHVLIVTHTFFWGLSELLLGISLMFPLFAMMFQTGKPVKPFLLYPLLLTGIFIVAFSHPLILFPFLFVAAFLWMSKYENIDKKLLLVATITFVMIIGAKTLLLSDDYETSSASGIKNFVRLFPNYFSQYSNIRFAHNLLHIYYWLPVVFTIVLFTYIRQRQWLKLLLVTVACIGYSQLINISYPTNKSFDFYMENMYVPLCVFLALPLVMDVFATLNKKVIVMLSLLIFLTAFQRVYTTRNVYTARIDWYRGYLDQYANQKILVNMANKPESTIMLEWASPYEFWLLSTLERDSTASITIHKNVDEIGWAYDNYRAFVTTWGVYPYKELNPVYFKFKDTSTHYSVYKDR